MESIHHTCENCGSVFIIKYEMSECEDDPNFCPFCAEIMIDADFNDDDE